MSKAAAAPARKRPRQPEPSVSAPDVSKDRGTTLTALALGLDGDGFSWLLRNNSEQARKTRQAVARLTYHASKCGGYVLGRQRSLTGMRDMLAGTRQVIARSPPGPLKSGTQLERRDCFAPVAIQELSAEGRSGLGVVSAASTHHCGGGFETGGRHALEESLCVQTTLFASLKKAHSQFRTEAVVAKGSASLRRGYIPRDGVVLSPSVDLFRSDCLAGYAFLEEPIRLAAVISVAMFNCNPRVRDAPLDAPKELTAYKDAIRQKWRSVLLAASLAKVHILVVPDVGCGVYKNDACVVGRLLGEVLRHDFWGAVERVVLVGREDFKDAVAAAVDGASVPSSSEQPVVLSSLLNSSDRRSGPEFEAPGIASRVSEAHTVSDVPCEAPGTPSILELAATSGSPEPSSSWKLPKRSCSVITLDSDDEPPVDPVQRLCNLEVIPPNGVSLSAPDIPAASSRPFAPKSLRAADGRSNSESTSAKASALPASDEKTQSMIKSFFKLKRSHASMDLET